MTEPLRLIVAGTDCDACGEVRAVLARNPKNPDVLPVLIRCPGCNPAPKETPA